MIIIDIISFLIHLCEAAIEAKTGDRSHWKSVLIVYLFITACALLEYSQCYGSIGPIALLILLIEAFLAFVAGRSYFDQFYNWFKSKVNSYTGKNAKTDKWLPKLRAKIGFRNELRLRGLLIIVSLIIQIII